MEKDKKLDLSRRFLQWDKKSTWALFLGFTLTFLLLTAMLSLVHTNFHIAAIQAKTEFTPSDCYIDGLSKEQLSQLRADEDIQWMGIQKGERQLYRKNHQNVFVTASDQEAMTMMTRISQGRLPDREGEIAAEKWVLLNLGIEPVPNQTVKIAKSDSQEEQEFYLTGILEDIYGNKRYGLLELYEACEEDEKGEYLAYLEFQNGVNYREKIKELKDTLHISGENIRECPARENFQSLYLLDVQLLAVLTAVCLVVFYGIYRIVVTSRREQYGILRAIGMKQSQMRKMLLLEISRIYLSSILPGTFAGILLADFVMKLSGDQDVEVYLHNEAVRFCLVIPAVPILGSILTVGLLSGVIVFLTGRALGRDSVTEILSGRRQGFGNFARGFLLERAKTKTGLLIRMGCKYLIRDWRSSMMVILTLSVGMILFTGLFYQAYTRSIYREDTRELNYLNGQYAMSMLYFDQAEQGVKREDVEEIRKMEEIASVKTSASVPIRVIDEDSVKRNETYYNQLLARQEEIYGYADAGFDGKNQIYKSMLSGYNQEALKALRNYVVEGDFDPEHLGENEVILSVMRTVEGGQTPGPYSDGTLLMEYHAGDQIRVKYRTDLETGSMEYEKLTDVQAAYEYRTYTIAAVVSFPYMYDCNRNVYPVLITEDEQIQKIAPDSSYQCIYLDGRKNLSPSEQTMLERKLIRIASQNPGISTRSLIAEIRQNEMFYTKQMVYICGIAIVSLILMLICVGNQLSYRMRIRTREISMLRAVGMSVAMVNRIFLFENLVLGFLAALLAYLLSWPVLWYLYERSWMQAFHHGFVFAYPAFTMVSAATLIICILVSRSLKKIWKSRKIAEEIQAGR